MLEYRSVADLNRLIVHNLGRFDRSIDLVVGIPRSGMLPATLLALHLNIPLVDLEAYVKGMPPGGGQRLATAQAQASVKESLTKRKVLVVDDSSLTGGAMARARRRIAAMSDNGDDLMYAAVYVHPDQRQAVDIWLETIPHRVFEWNVMNHPILSASCVDIDGVLCRDPTEQENDDGEAYMRFIASVPPLLQPSYEMGWIVTCRLEKYRRPTEVWLRTNNIRYRTLAMLDLPTGAERASRGRHAEFKAKIFRAVPAKLFIESSARQAHQIARLSRKPVYCIEDREMYYHLPLETLKRREALTAPVAAFLNSRLPQPVVQTMRRLARRR